MEASGATTKPVSILRTKSLLSEQEREEEKQEQHRVQFTGKDSIQKVTSLEPEEVIQLFYTKYEIKRFRNEEREQQQEELAEFIHHLVGKISKDMDLRMERVEALQSIEQELLIKAHQQETTTTGSGDYDDNEHNNLLILFNKYSDEELAMIKLEDAQEEKRYQREERVLSKQVERQIAKIRDTMGSPVSVFDTHKIDTNILEDSLSELINFDPLDF